MGCHMIDSILFSENYLTPKMKEIWEDVAIMKNWLNLEAALAQSQAELGIISHEVAEEIARKAKVELLDMEAIKKDIAKTGHSMVPVIRELQRKCAGNAGEFVHLGATTQDVIDVGLILAAQRAFAVIYEDVYEIEEILVNLAEKHKKTVMAGRSHTQHALPITFGYKVAVWASEVHRNLERMRQVRERDFVGQLSGAVGTMAGFGAHAFALEEKVMAKLGLAVPDISWHVSRDRIASIANMLALLTGTFAKIGNEVLNLQKTETSELAEPWVQGNVGSSTMPHKRNPNASEAMVSLNRLVRGNWIQLHDSMMQEHERDGAAWKVEWVALPEAFIFTAAAAAKAKHVLRGLVVNVDKMEINLNILKGLLLSEAAMFSLGEKMGKQTAHELVYEISMRAFQDDAQFKDYLLADETVRNSVSAEELDRILDPHQYTGHSVAIAERVIENIRQARASQK